MTIFLDTDYKCHIEDNSTKQAYETEFFNGKCKIFIKGYRLIPKDKTWIQENGEIFKTQGETIFPQRPFDLLQEFQIQYEEMLKQQKDMRAALNILGVDDK